MPDRSSLILDWSSPLDVLLMKRLHRHEPDSNFHRRTRSIPVRKAQRVFRELNLGIARERGIANFEYQSGVTWI